MDKSVRKALLLAASLSVLQACNSETANRQNIGSTQKIELSKRIQDLQQLPGWTSLKQLWQKLDAIPPKDSTNFGGPYMGTLNSQDAQQYQKELEEIRFQLGIKSPRNWNSFKDDDKTSAAKGEAFKENQLTRRALISDLEAELLCELTEYRMSLFQHGPHTMFTRMMINPASPRVRNEKTVAALEKQIDLILSLKEQKKISSEESDKALQGLQETIFEYAVNSIVQNGYRWSSEFGFGASSLDEEGSSVEKVEEQLDAHFLNLEKRFSGQQISAATEKSYKGYKMNYRQTKERLLELKKCRPSLQELVAELQR